jgi:hypothetical protein
MMSHLLLDVNQSPKRLWKQITDLGLKKASPIIGDVDVNGLNEFFTSPGPNAGGVAVSVLFHDFTPFLFRSVSVQEVAEAAFSLKSEAIGLDNVSLKFVNLLNPPNYKFFQLLLYSRHISEELEIGQNIQPIWFFRLPPNFAMFIEGF